MFATILNRQYPIEIAEKPLRDEQGRPCMAKLQQNPRRILLSPDLPPADRLRELIHEIRHAWTSELGVPGNDESDARDVAAFTDAILEQLEAQGGRSALIGLTPRCTAYKSPIAGVALNYRHACKVCTADTMTGSVRTRNLRLHEAFGVHIADRSFECEACGSVNRWVEICDERGTPLGQPCPGHEYQTS